MQDEDFSAFANLSPFELKDKLISVATTESQKVMLNAGRGNPNWLADEPRHLRLRRLYCAPQRFEQLIELLNLRVCLGQFGLQIGGIELGDKIGGRDTKRGGQVKQGDDRWIAQAALQIADILLGKTGRLGKALLGKALILPQLGEVQSH